MRKRIGKKLEGKLEGKIEGKMEGKMEIAKSLKDMGVLTATIIASTGLTKEEIEKL